MGNEFQHLTVGGVISQAEYEAIGGHIFDSQAEGDILIATAADQLSRLAKGAAGKILTMGAARPQWDDPATHSASHENIGGDEISVAALSGLLADDQHVIDAEAIAAIEAEATVVLSGSLSVTDATASTSKTTGSGKFAGGVGVVGNIWASNIGVLSTIGGSGVSITAMIPASGTGQMALEFIQGTGTGAANNMSYSFEYQPASDVLRLYSRDIDGSATAGAIFSVADGTNDVVFSGNIYALAALDTPDGMGADGEQLTSGGNNVAMDWSAAGSLREFKDIHGLLDPKEALAAMLSAPVRLFNYRERQADGSHAITTGDTLTEYAGVMADEAPWAMHHHGKIVNPVNTLGYTVASIQALEARVRELEAAVA